ncbi:KPN_02809 family neutral zinc metallopeptidase [Actinoplanes sp. HUAS TT8]|uniref:KPN_02809 family neutral zinc metallopeptidase n=1 Tax=Actinoplanes sp. HUAS TT8 TaxID=3447453 RepID=UPI003F522267
MELNERAELDSSQVNDLGSSGGSGGGGFNLPIGGGGLAGIIITVLLALIGGGIGLHSATSDDNSPSSGGTDLGQACAQSNPDRFKNVKCRNLLYVNSIQSYWQQEYPKITSGKKYELADTNYFENRVNTGCGAADSGVGPFYCPQDHQVYIDLSFYNELSSRFGADGEFAAPYVLAHEYGHHIQDLLGTNAKAAQGEQTGASSASVRLELQADCYAGTWAKHATESRDKTGQQPLFTSITATDISQAIDTAEAIGDDTIQKKSGGSVNPDQFTHGTSAQRKKWFSQGYQSGNPENCDTFGASSL